MEWIFQTQRWLYSGAIDTLREMSTTGLSGLPVLVATAFLFGLLHALLPGHGKSVLASYYAGAGEWRSAIASSIILIVTHVGSAILIVLGGFAIIQKTIGGAGRAPTLEFASHVFIVVMGLWLIWKALRPHSHTTAKSSSVLAFATGIIPCPLTAFMMTFALSNGLLWAGLLLSATFAIGMTVTVAAFPLLAILARERLVAMLATSQIWRARIGRWIELLAALSILAIGALPLLKSPLPFI